MKKVHRNLNCAACITPGKTEIPVGGAVQENGIQYNCTKANDTVNFVWAIATQCLLANGTYVTVGTTDRIGNASYSCTKNANGQVQWAATNCLDSNGNSVAINQTYTAKTTFWNYGT